MKNNRQKTTTICVLDAYYVRETLRLLHAAVNRKEGHSATTYQRFLKSISILEDPS